ncbi:hypothetical protein EK21DRAFT_84022 [Setomelanomma holmii]|uniref:Uncharacterized protein n=1 Tax=Setomelanomma holmii TaxID=210430 RepID=A0A9P4HJB8_9PLEO|nr:hypothetical protein EK21DRAFT_84022 [Setomelanomma holmii]
MAVGNRLPTELLHLVLDQTLLGEGIHSDPRIMFGAQDPTGYAEEKCTMMCGHEEPNAQTSFGLRFVYVHGDQWTPCYKFSHSVDSYLDLLDEEFAAEEATRKKFEEEGGKKPAIEEENVSSEGDEEDASSSSEAEDADE